MKKQNFQDRVYVERVRLFLGNALGNVGSAVIGALFIALVLKSADVNIYHISIWLGFIVFFSAVTIYIERLLSKEVLSIENASKWLYMRITPSIFIPFSYGLVPFIFGSHLGTQEEMFIFIIFSAVVSVSIVGYTTMPYYFTLINMLTMFPLTIYFISCSDEKHYLLALTSILWQFLLISKGWKVSKLAIESIQFNEQLHDEIQHHKETKEQLHQLATHDILTDLPNRRLLMQRLDDMITFARRHRKKIIVMFIDLDGFKNVNDTYGHEAGDHVLKEVSKGLATHMRDSDTIARLGGDEFVLSFIEMEDKPLDIDILAKRIIDSLSKPITLPNTQVAQVGLSIGIAIFPKDGKSSEDLLRKADANMYISKSQGGETFTYSSE